MLKKWVFYPNNYLSHECCVLLSTRQQIPHFHPLLSHDRDQQERERVGREKKRAIISCNANDLQMFVTIVVMLVLGLG